MVDETLANKQNQDRVFGLDLLRLFFFVSIYGYHAHDFFYGANPTSFDVNRPLLWELGNLWARLGAFSGFALVFLTFFLYGMKNKPAPKTLIIFLLPIFWFIFCALNTSKDYLSFRLVWDIYPLLFCSFVMIWFLEKFFSRLQSIVFILCLLALFYGKAPILREKPGFLTEMLVGLCPLDYGDWPIFPWLSLPYVGYFCGKQAKLYDESLRKLYAVDLPLSLAIGGFYLYSFDAYFNTPLGTSWACYTFNRPGWQFCSHLAFWAYMTRLSFVLGESKFLRFVSGLAINRHFFLAYFLHYGILFALAAIFHAHGLMTEPFALNIVFIAGLLATEILTAYLVKLWNIDPKGSKLGRALVS